MNANPFSDSKTKLEMIRVAFIFDSDYWFVIFNFHFYFAFQKLISTN